MGSNCPAWSDGREEAAADGQPGTVMVTKAADGTGEGVRRPATGWRAAWKLAQCGLLVLSAVHGLRGAVAFALGSGLLSAVANFIDTLPADSEPRRFLVRWNMAVADPPSPVIEGPVPPPALARVGAAAGDPSPETGLERIRRVAPMRRACVGLASFEVLAGLVWSGTGWRISAAAGLLSYFLFVLRAPALRDDCGTPAAPRRAVAPLVAARALGVPESWYVPVPPSTVPSLALWPLAVLLLALLVGPGVVVRSVGTSHSVRVPGGYALSLTRPTAAPTPDPGASPSSSPSTSASSSSGARGAATSSRPSSPGPPPAPGCVRDGRPARRIAEGPEPPDVRAGLTTAYTNSGWPTVGCVYGLPVPVPSGGWTVSTQSGYTGTTNVEWLRGRPHLVYDAYVVPESLVAGVVDISDRVGVGAADLQMTSEADGGCHVFERQASEAVVDMPGQVAVLVASVGERFPDAFPVTTGVDYLGGYETFAVTLVRPTAERPGYRPVGQFTVTLDPRTGLASAAGYVKDTRLGCGNVAAEFVSEGADVAASARAQSGGS